MIKKAGEEGQDDLKEALIEIAGKDRSVICPVRLGRRLQSFEGRIEGGYMLQRAGSAQGAKLWSVKKVG